MTAREAMTRRHGPSPVRISCRVCGRPIEAGEDAILVRAPECAANGRDEWVPVVHPSCAASQERW
jgi:hypothetical protein